MAELKWETISSGTETISRAKIFGGWLITSVNEVRSPIYMGYDIPEYKEGYEWRTSITFVPDPSHEWKLEENG